jgi:hypothetical protein
MRRFSSSLLLIATLLATGCGLFDDSFEITGMVRFTSVEGGCWMIEGDDGHTYEPNNLPSEYLVDSLRIRATVEIRTDLKSTCQLGSIIDVLEVERQ